MIDVDLDAGVGFTIRSKAQTSSRWSPTRCRHGREKCSLSGIGPQYTAAGNSLFHIRHFQRQDYADNLIRRGSFPTCCLSRERNDMTCSSGRMGLNLYSSMPAFLYETNADWPFDSPTSCNYHLYRAGQEQCRSGRGTWSGSPVCNREGSLS